jgi:hypothetical protein
MASSQGSKKKPFGSLVLFGVVAGLLYAALLTHQDVVNNYFTRGGMYAFLPISAAFVFSFFHGNFTSAFWTVMGVEASKKKKEVR